MSGGIQRGALSHRFVVAAMVVALVMWLAPPAGAAQWYESDLGAGGMECDLDANGLNDGYAASTIPFEYRFVGRVTAGDLDGVAGVFVRKFVWRQTDVLYEAGGRGPDLTDVPAFVSGPAVFESEPEDVLVSGKQTVIGEFFFADPSDYSTIEVLSDKVTDVWTNVLFDVDGDFLTVTGGTITIDTTTGEFTFGPSFGRCWNP